MARSPVEGSRPRGKRPFRRSSCRRRGRGSTAASGGGRNDSGGRRARLSCFARNGGARQAPPGKKAERSRWSRPRLWPNRHTDKAAARGWPSGECRVRAALSFSGAEASKVVVAELGGEIGAKAVGDENTQIGVPVVAARDKEMRFDVIGAGAHGQAIARPAAGGVIVDGHVETAQPWPGNPGRQDGRRRGRRPWGSAA